VKKTNFDNLRKTFQQENIKSWLMYSCLHQSGLFLNRKRQDYIFLHTVIQHFMYTLSIWQDNLSDCSSNEARKKRVHWSSDRVLYLCMCVLWTFMWHASHSSCTIPVSICLTQLGKYLCCKLAKLLLIPQFQTMSVFCGTIVLTIQTYALPCSQQLRKIQLHLNNCNQTAEEC